MIPISWSSSAKWMICISIPYCRPSQSVQMTAGFSSNSWSFSLKSADPGIDPWYWAFTGIGFDIRIWSMYKNKGTVTYHVQSQWALHHHHEVLLRHCRRWWRDWIIYIESMNTEWHRDPIDNQYDNMYSSTFNAIWVLTVPLSNSTEIERDKMTGDQQTNEKNQNNGETVEMASQWMLRNSAKLVGAVTVPHALSGKDDAMWWEP